ncbi:MAG: hypothetical protein AAF741_12485 [Bacteroidota bacterium]
MTDSKTKTYTYSIKRFLFQLSRGQRIIKREELMTAMEIGASQLYKIMNSTEDELRNMTALQAKAAAEVLGVSVDELIEPYTPPAQRA